MTTASSRLPVVVLISGGGSNLQALIDAAQDDLPIRINAVISNSPDAFGLKRAERADIPALVLDHRTFPDRDTYDTALRELIDRHQPGLVVLAGFMRLLSDRFVHHYRGRMLNIHPSLLPKHRGLHTHSRCLEAGDREHGATVHFVTPELDSGPPIIQARVPVRPDDTPETLAARVLECEHKIYPLAIRWFAEGRVALVDGAARFDDEPLEQPKVYSETKP